MTAWFPAARMGEAFAARFQVTRDYRPANASPQQDASTRRTPVGTAPGSLGAIIQNFKSTSTRKINQVRDMPGVPVWQGNYYERIVRDEVELNQFRRYAQENPLRWMEDDEYV